MFCDVLKYNTVYILSIKCKTEILKIQLYSDIY